MNPIMIGGIISVLLYFVGVFVAFGLTKHHIDKLYKSRIRYDSEVVWLKYGIISLTWPVSLLIIGVMNVIWDLRKIIGFPYYLTLWALDYPERRRERKKNQKFVFIGEGNKAMEFSSHEHLQEYFNSLRAKFVDLIRQRDRIKQTALEQEDQAVEALNANYNLDKQNKYLREMLDSANHDWANLRKERNDLQRRVEGMPESRRSVQTRWKRVADMREKDIKDLQGIVDEKNNDIVTLQNRIDAFEEKVVTQQDVINERDKEVGTQFVKILSHDNELVALQDKVHALQSQVVDELKRSDKLTEELDSLKNHP